MVSLKPLRLVTNRRSQEAYAAFEAIYSRITSLPSVIDFHQLTDQERDLFDQAAEAYDNYLASLESEPA